MILLEELLISHTDVVKLLLKDKRVDPSADDNYAIREASIKGHTEVVKLLLDNPKVDPSDYDNWAIKSATLHAHNEVVKLLIEDPRVRKKLKPKEIEKYENFILEIN